MKVNQVKIDKLIEQLDGILEEIESAEMLNSGAISSATSSYEKSARNLVHYNALRTHDIRGIQKKLKNYGMSRLANSQGHVKASLLMTRYLLNCLLGRTPVHNKSGLSIKTARSLLARNTKALLGYRSKRRRVRIMVTQPTEAAHNYSVVLEMIKNGMNCARINCAHDNPVIWEKIIENVKKASNSQGRKVKICMDLAGPKIRTGQITPGAKVKKFSPVRDEIGKVTTPATIRFVPQLTEDSNKEDLPVESSWLNKLRPSDYLSFRDTRGKERRLQIVSGNEDYAVATCKDTCYIGTGTILVPEDGHLAQVAVGEIPAVEQSIVLRPNDTIIIHRDDIPGEPAEFDETGALVKPAHVSCQLPEVFSSVQNGEKILFDDGKIEGVIQNCHPDHFEVLITRARERGSRLKAEKGINFPTSELGISGLTSKDKRDLEFVAKHADVVNFSFVNNREDVEQLVTELERLEVRDRLSIILKIETRQAFDNLTEILLTAMKTRYIGVMIARGDLAVETGWDNIGRIQREILSLCNAGHVPVIWATQVLENLAKKGLPSRSEITDATSSLKAECVMLNKGNHINEAIKLLDKILSDMENLDEKNEPMLPKLEKFLPLGTSLPD